MRRVNDRGFAILETAYMGVVLATLIIGGVAVYDYLTTTISTRDLVDKFLYDDGTKPLKLSKENPGMLPQIKVDHEAIQARLTRAIDGALQGIEDLPGRHESSDFRVEARYGLVSLDPRTGRVSGISMHPFKVEKGELSDIPADSLNSTDLEQAVIRFASTTRDGGASLLAVPSALNGGGLGGAEFVDIAVVVGMRCFLKFNRGFSSYIFDTSGGEGVISDYKVIELRGELK